MILKVHKAVSLRAWEPLYRSMEAKAIWLHGDPAALRAAFLAAEATARPDEWPIGQTVRAMLRALVAMAEGNHAAAESLLLAARDEQQRHPEARLASDARLLLAHLYLVSGRPADALTALAPALDACAADDTPGFFLLEGVPVAAPLLRLALDHGAHTFFVTRALALLEAQSAERQGKQKAESKNLKAEPHVGAVSAFSFQLSALPEPLTPREVEILRLLAGGASNQAIADRLVISLHTVKRHVTNLHQKLGVASRLEAVARARELGLV